jgi:hypothetical protein
VYDKQKVADGKGMMKYFKDTNANSTGLPRTAGKETDERSVGNTGEKQGGGKCKGKHWERNDRKNAKSQAPIVKKPQVPVDQRTELAKVDGSKDATHKKPQASTDSKVEASKPEPANDTGNKQLPVPIDQPADSVKQDIKGKEVGIPKKTPVTNETEAVSTTTKAKVKDDKKNKVQDIKRPEPRVDLGAAKASDTTATPTITGASSIIDTSSAKPKQGKAKNRPVPKKGVIGAQPPVGMASSSSGGAENKKAASSKGADASTTKPAAQSQSKHTKSLINTDDFPALPAGSASQVAKNPIALAPIPLPVPSNPWIRVDGPQPSKSDKGAKTESNERGPPHGERKGG